MILSRHAIEWTVTIDKGLAHEHGVTDFGILDEKGRKVGFSATIRERKPEEIRPKTDDEKRARHIPLNWADPADGKPWEMWYGATRNGVRYGSSNPERYFVHELDARAAAERIASETHRRYAKKYAR